MSTLGAALSLGFCTGADTTTSTYAHPATPEAACLERFLDFDYELLSRHTDKLHPPVEWISTSLIEADEQPGGLRVLPLDEASLVAEAAEDPGATAALERFARRTLAMLNALNELLLERATQISSAELTFQLRSRPETYLMLHCDNEERDPRTALFTVALRHGSQATVLSSSADTTASDARCKAASDHHGLTAACASDRAGAATYLPLHVCHSRPAARSQRAALRDVAAVHVRWTQEPPAAEEVAHMVQELQGIGGLGSTTTDTERSLLDRFIENVTLK